MRRWIAACMALVAATAWVVGQDKSPAIPAAAAPDVAALKQQRADADKERSTLQAKLNERVGVLAKQDALAKLQSLADEADAKYRKYLQTDPKLEDVRKGIQTAAATLQPAIDKAAAEDKEGSVNRSTRESLVKAGYERDYQIGLLDFEYERKVKRLVGDDPAVVAARQVAVQAEQKLRETEHADSKIQDLRQAADIARRRHALAQEDAKNDAYKQAWNALQAANKAQADALVSLASRKALEAAKNEAEVAYKSKMAADEEGNALRAEHAKLLKDRAEIDYQISMVENKLQSGVSRRIARDPAVSKANEATQKAEVAFRQESDSDARVAAARKAHQDALKTFKEQEQAVKAGPAVMSASKAVEAAESALDEARKALLQKALDTLSEARKNEAEVFAAKLASDASAKAIQEKRAGMIAMRDADQKRMHELDVAFGAVRDRVSKENADMAKIKESIASANAAYEKAVKESDAPNLDKARDAARAAARKALEDAVAADEGSKALKQQIDALSTKIKDLDRQINKSEAPAPKPAAAQSVAPAPAAAKPDAATKQK